MYEKLKNLFTQNTNQQEVLNVLRSIDKRLQSLERCVTTGSPNHTNGRRPRIITGHWNDSL